MVLIVSQSSGYLLKLSVVLRKDMSHQVARRNRDITGSCV